MIKALERAQQGDVETGLVFSGNNMRKVDEILFSVFERIEAAEIWIPEDEIYKHYQSRHSKLLKRLKKEFSEDFQDENVTE